VAAGRSPLLRWSYLDRRHLKLVFGHCLGRDCDRTLASYLGSCRRARCSLRATIVSTVTGAAVGRTFSLAAGDRDVDKSRGRRIRDQPQSAEAESTAFVPRYQKFESISLQQGVRREPDFLVLGCRHSDSTIRVGSRWTAPCRTHPTTISMAVAFTSIPILVGEFMLQNSGDFPPIGRFRCDPVDVNQSRNGSVGCDRRPPNPVPSVLGWGRQGTAAVFAGDGDVDELRG
jgi:hypothetical protein